MKVAILTFARTNNYGATLQCYALNKYIQSLGHETVILNVPLDDGSARPRKQACLLKRILRYGIQLAKRIANRVQRGMKLNDFEIRYQLNADQQNEEQRYSKENMLLFDDFRAEYLPNITKEYFTFDDFENDYPEADAYVVGSDQVWNTQITGWQYPLFFLSFVKADAKRIAYAACMGGNGNVIYPKVQKYRIKDLLSKFDNIAVRNEMAVQICQNNFGFLPQQVLDPTFLINDYNELLKETTIDASGSFFIDKYIINEPWMTVIREIANQTDLKIRMDRCLIPIEGVPFSPLCKVQDWLGIINTSSLIFTDSFHCSVFCILFHKQFVVAPSYKGGEGRMFDLLSKFGLEDRFFHSPSDMLKNIDTCMIPIDYEKVDKKIRLLRKEAREYLYDALS